MLLLRLVFGIIWILVSCSVLAQSMSKQDVKRLISVSRFEEALEALSMYQNSKDEQILWLRAQAYLGLSNCDAAISQLSTIDPSGFNNLALFELGSALQLCDRPKEAADAFKLLLSLDILDDAQLEMVKLKLLHCKSAIPAQYKTVVGFVENLGTAINSAFDEVSPIQSHTDPSRFYFSTNKVGTTGGYRNSLGYKDEAFGNHSFDMYSASLSNGNWINVLPLDFLLNTSANEVIEDCSEDGQKLYYTKYKIKEEVALYIDTFGLSEDFDFKTGEVIESYFPQIGDKNWTVINDSLAMFASNRQGGFGGYDLYMISRSNRGWSSAINLGRFVNTPFDEVSPHFNQQSASLYYSSNRPESIGGYDVFVQSFILENGSWTAPLSLGPPVNSAGDDLDVCIHSDQLSLTLSSNRAGGYGGMDLYYVYLADPLKTNDFEIGLNELKQAAYVDPAKVTEIVTSQVKPDIPSLELVLSTFEIRNGLLSGIETKMATNIVESLNIFPNAEVVIESDVETGVHKALDLFYAMKRGEILASFLADYGIEPDRYSIISKGSYVPRFKQELGNSGNKYNEFVRVSILSKSNKLTVISSLPLLDDALIDDRFRQVEEEESWLYFSLKFHESAQAMRTPMFQEDDDFFLVNDGGSSYKYYKGRYQKLSEAQKALVELFRENFSEVEIQLFNSKQRVNRSELVGLAAENEEVAAYLDYLNQLGK